MQCCDNQSFRWCLLADKYGDGLDNPQQVSQYYQYHNEFSEYRCAMDNKNIDVFERKEHNSVNVYVLINNKKVNPLRLTSLNPKNVYRHVDLLLLEGGHYVLIRNLSRLCTKQVNNHDGARFLCKRCLWMCISEAILEKYV